MTDRVRQILAGAPAHPVGTYRYSLGYVLLSAVLAYAAASSSAQLVREVVLGPLGFSRTTIGEPGRGPVGAGYRHGEPIPGMRHRHHVRHRRHLVHCE